jgi:methylmalonyl-CoA/ethylmalonyl-CoA epimerase
MRDSTLDGLSKIGQVALTVHDLKHAVGFYRDSLGMKLLFEAPPSLAFFDCAGVRFMLSTPEREFKPGGGSVIYFRVADIHATFEAFRARGVNFIDKPHLITKMPDHELWMTFFKDPDGNTLALMAEVRN